MSAGGTQAAASEAMLPVLPLHTATSTVLGETSRGLFELLLDHYLNTEDMATIPPWNTKEKTQLFLFFSFFLFSLL